MKNKLLQKATIMTIITHPAALFRARDAVLTTSPSAKTSYNQSNWCDAKSNSLKRMNNKNLTLRLITLSRMVPYLHTKSISPNSNAFKKILKATIFFS